MRHVLLAGMVVVLVALGTLGTAVSQSAPLSCDVGLLPCSTLTISHLGVPDSIIAAPDLPFVLTVVVRNNPVVPPPTTIPVIRVPAGTLLFRETLPTILATTDTRPPSLSVLRELGLPGSGSQTWPILRVPDVDNAVDVVAYAGADTPLGYTCSLSSPTSSLVECRTTMADTIPPGGERVFQLRLRLFDRQHPYIVVDDALMRSGQPVTLTTSASASLVFDGSASQNTAQADIMVKAPVMRFEFALSGYDCTSAMPGCVPDCPLNTRISSDTWICAIHVRTNQSSAPARLSPGDLEMSLQGEVFADQPHTTYSCGALRDGQAWPSALACQASVVPLQCGFDNYGTCQERIVRCTSIGPAAVPDGVDLSCQMRVTLDASARPQAIHFDTTFFTASVGPGVIRFASRATVVALSGDITGGNANEVPGGIVDF